MTELPQEIVDIIVDLVHHSPCVAPSKSTLDVKSTLNCALVCSSWRSPAQQHIFESVSATPRPFFDTFLRPTIDEASKQALRHVKSMHIFATLGGRIGSHEGLADVLSLALERCTSLCALRIVSNLPPGGIPSEHLLRLRQVAASPSLPLRTLRFSEYTDPSPLFGQLMISFPSLESVETSVDCPPHFEECKARLTDLRVSGDNSLAPNTVSWILQSSHSSLRILEVQVFMVLSPVVEVLKPCLQDLRSLRLNCACGPLLSLVKLCPNLQELAFVDPDAETFSPQVDCNTIPAPLEHWWVHFHGPITSKRLEPYVAVIKAKPTLRHFTFSEPNFVNSIGYPALEETCRDRGVALAFWRKNWSDNSVFPSSALPTHNWG